MRKTKSFVAVVAALLMSASARAAAPLADRVPADALVYLGWAGADSAAGYDASHLKAVVDASAMPQLFQQVLPQLVRQVAKQDPQSAETLKQILLLGGPMWHHPSAFYFGGVDLGNGPPTPKVAILCDAGADGPVVVEQLNKIRDDAAKNAGTDLGVTIKQYGTLVVVAYGNEPAADAMFRAPTDTLAKSPDFVAAMKQMPASSVYVGYADARGIVAKIDQTMAQAGQPEQAAKWKTIKASLGLDDLRQAVVAGGFDGKDWIDQGFVSTAGHAGIAGMFDAKPLDSAVLATVPKTADKMTAGQFDVGAFVDEIRKGVSQMDAGTAEQVDEGFAKANEAAGLDVQKDFLDLLGSQWVTYSDRTIGGRGAMGSVVVNKLKDAAKFDSALTLLAGRANQIIAQQMKQPDVKLAFSQEVVDGVTLHYFAIPLVTPTWAIKDGNLYLGLYPQVVSAAVAQVTSKSPSILDRPEFVAVMKRLGDHPASAEEFTDLPATAPDGYTDLLALARLFLGAADVGGVKTPAMTIPPLAKIMPHLAPEGGVSWADTAGWHYKAVSPFPGSSVFAGTMDMSSTTVGEGALMTSILLPSLNKARETANRAKCASNMHQIGLAILLYQNDNQQKYPDDLGVLVTAEQISPQCFTCPSGNTTVPANFVTMTADEKAKWIDDNSDYVYVGKGMKNPNADDVVLYEKEPNHDGDGMNMLFGDGHVEWENMARARELIQKIQAK